MGPPFAAHLADSSPMSSAHQRLNLSTLSVQNPPKFAQQGGGLDSSSFSSRFLLAEVVLPRAGTFILTVNFTKCLIRLAITNVRSVKRCRQIRADA